MAESAGNVAGLAVPVLVGASRRVTILGVGALAKAVLAVAVLRVGTRAGGLAEAVLRVGTRAGGLAEAVLGLDALADIVPGVIGAKTVLAVTGLAEAVLAVTSLVVAVLVEAVLTVAVLVKAVLAVTVLAVA